MPENFRKFYEKMYLGFNVEIFSPEETKSKKGFTLKVYNDYIESLTNSLLKNPDFISFFKDRGSIDQDVKRMVGIILCHDIRMQRRREDAEIEH